MNNFYPKGAIKGQKEVEKLLEERKGDLYLINDTQLVYKIRLTPETKITKFGPKEWAIENPINTSVFHLRLTDSNYLESSITRGYVFSNFWHAWAHANYLEQSGFPVDWCFPVGVG